MRRIAIAAFSFMAATMAAAQYSTPLTPLRLAVIHQAAAPSTTPGDCISGTSPNVVDDSTGDIYTCRDDGSSDYYEALPLSTDSEVVSAIAALGITNASDPIFEYQPISTDTGGGWRMFSGNTGSTAPIPYFQCTQAKTTGIVTCDAVNGSTHTFVFSDAISASNLSGTNTGDQTTITGNAGTATALASNAANCSAGSGAGGVDASGAAEDCTAYQPLDANELSSIAGLTSAADKFPYYTGSGTAALASCDSTCRGLLDDTTAAAQRATVGAAYAIQISQQNVALNPADASTYYCGYQLSCTTTQGLQSKMYIVRAGVIRAAEITISTTGATNGSNEDISCYVRLNNTTDTLIATVGTTDQDRQFRNASLSITVAAGDYVEVKCVFPTWATNPLSVRFGGYLLVE